MGNNIWIPQPLTRQCPNCKALQVIPADSPTLVKCNNCEVVSPLVDTAPVINTLGLSYSGKYSTYRGQYIYILDYNHMEWKQISFQNIGPVPHSINIPGLPNPDDYISPDNNIQVRIFSQSDTPYIARFDLLKLIVNGMGNFCTGVSFVDGKGEIVSGDHTSLNGKDGISLVVKSVLQLSYHYIDLQAEFKVTP